MSLTNWAKSAMYVGLEALTAGRGIRRQIHGEPIRFPARWSRYYPADYEPETFRFIADRCRPGQTVLDLGAHLGLFSILMARRVGPEGRVYSFEPTASTRAALERVVRLNDCSGVIEVRPEAVTGHSGTVVFHQSDEPVSNANSLVPSSRATSKVEVAAITLDGFLAERGGLAHVIKIDVEGAELDVLRGGERTLAACRPAIWLSVHPPLFKPGRGLPELWDFVTQLDLTVLNEGKPVVRSCFCEQQGLFDVQVLPKVSI